MAERLQVHPHCLMFFVDETGDEDFADPKYPIFGLGGCAVMAGAVDDAIKRPWRDLKAAYFGGADKPLHAAALRDITDQQALALGNFFRKQAFGRFAVTMTGKTELPEGHRPLDVLPNLLRRRWEELASRCSPTPVEFALLHEASQRGDPLIERFFGTTIIRINGIEVPVHHGFMPKASDEALEVADFVVQAAGQQANRWANGNRTFRRDFQAVFQSNPNWSSFFAVETAKLEGEHS